jgi:Glycosyl hydrolase family 30 TIM-barrel domain
MPACLWGQEYEIEFVKEHLGPALKANGVSAKIRLIDHNYDLWGRAICELDDSDVRKYANAVAWHGYAGGDSMASRIHDAHPDAEMHWTEGGPDYTRPDYATDWDEWGQTLTGALRNWCQSITGWNLARRAGSSQHRPVSVSREDQIPAREGRHNNNDDISTQPLPSDARAGGGQGVSFPASPLCLRYGARVKLHPPVRKRWYADSPAPKVARTHLSAARHRR